MTYKKFEPTFIQPNWNVLQLGYNEPCEGCQKNKIMPHLDHTNAPTHMNETHLKVRSHNNKTIKKDFLNSEPLRHILLCRSVQP